MQPQTFQGGGAGGLPVKTAVVILGVDVFHYLQVVKRHIFVSFSIIVRRFSLEYPVLYACSNQFWYSGVRIFSGM